MEFPDLNPDLKMRIYSGVVLFTYTQALKVFVAPG